MGPSPKSQKRSGAPKAKGAVRAKSGCYTCRIRRKKCDEQPDDKGQCQTCVRLRLECLGFGVKRPDWLRENRNVLELREKIKNFLASQGMIKGHSTAGTRSAEQEPAVLPLAINDNGSSSASPPTPTLSVGSNDDRLSSSHYPLRTPLSHYESDTSLNAPMEMSLDSPLGHSRGYQQDAFPAYGSSLLSSSLDSPWQLQTSPPSFTSRAITSGFGELYTRSYEAIEDEYSNDGSYGGYTQWNEPWRYSDDRQYESIRHYLEHVVNLQYFHTDDTSIQYLIWNIIQGNPTARDAACLISDLHRKSLNTGQRAHLREEDRPSYSRLHSAVTRTSSPTQGDALAGLCLVSYFLFAGGKGPWQDFLEVACNFSRMVLFDPYYQGPADAMIRCGESLNFIIKTSMWFDVLSAATLVRVPLFMDVYREIFSPPTTYIGEAPIPPPELSMLPVMGCENRIVYAFAETANLAVWKEDKRKVGQLSVPELIRKGQDIEKNLMPRSASNPFLAESDLAKRRYLTSEVFRASARVYLHSVLSGDFPNCPEIIDGVQETVDCLELVPENTTTSRSVVRSVVFSLCICACLTDQPRHQQYLLQRLERESTDLVGNCSEIMRLIHEVWNKRASGRPVDWRQVMRDSKMLLV